MTKLKTVLAAAALMAAPGLAFAEGCSWMKTQQAQSCAPGSSWDATAQTCTPDATG